MIRGYFLTRGDRRRPFVQAVFQFPNLSEQRFDVPLLVDTGADRTILAPLDARRLELELGLRLADLPLGTPSTGVGGVVATRRVQAQVSFDAVTLELPVTILDVPAGRMSSIPSLLGRDLLARFALFVEERTNRVLLLEPREADALSLRQ